MEKFISVLVIEIWLNYELCLIVVMIFMGMLISVVMMMVISVSLIVVGNSVRNLVRMGFFVMMELFRLFCSRLFR